ncbi:unnamed protein product [Trichobilharzia regenti]|nr:unnamed protein product [Trichobilharzia regenti]
MPLYDVAIVTYKSRGASISPSWKGPTQVKPMEDGQGNQITKEEKNIKQPVGHPKGLLSRPSSSATHSDPPPTAGPELPANGH